MSKAKGYTDADLAEVSDNPEWTEDDFARAKPFAEVFPELAERMQREGIVACASDDLVPIDREVLAHFKASGPGWESRINEALRKAAGL